MNFVECVIFSKTDPDAKFKTVMQNDEGGFVVTVEKDGSLSYIYNSNREFSSVSRKKGEKVTCFDVNFEVVYDPKTLLDVMPAFIDGKTIQRRSQSIIYSKDESRTFATLSAEDISATDWKICSYALNGITQEEFKNIRS